MPELKEKRNIVLYNLADKILDAPAQKTDRYFLFSEDCPTKKA